jgi:hypothetical protein
MRTYLNALHRLIYVSQATDFAATRAEAVMADILESAVRRNSAAGVSGALLACDQWFLQALEGSRVKVGEIYGLISNDRRHHSLRLIEAKPVEQRVFGKWSMCGQTLSARDAEIVQLLGARKALNPGSFSADGALKLLRVVRDLQGPD